MSKIARVDAGSRCQRISITNEAEYERAARAGTSTQYFFGNDRKVMEHYILRSNNTVSPVSSQRPDAKWVWFIRYLGNVWEWTGNWNRAFPKDREVDPRGDVRTSAVRVPGGRCLHI